MLKLWKLFTSIIIVSSPLVQIQYQICHFLRLPVGIIYYDTCNKKICQSCHYFHRHLNIVVNLRCYDASPEVLFPPYFPWSHEWSIWIQAFKGAIRCFWRNENLHELDRPTPWFGLKHTGLCKLPVNSMVYTHWNSILSALLKFWEKIAALVIQASLKKCRFNQRDRNNSKWAC